MLIHPINDIFCGKYGVTGIFICAAKGCAALPFSNSRPSRALGCVQAYAMLSTKAAAPAAFKRLPPPPNKQMFFTCLHFDFWFK